MKHKLYRLYTLLYRGNYLITLSWINGTHGKPAGFYKETIKDYDSMPVERRIFAELYIDELFSEDEAIQIKQFLEKLVPDGCRHSKRQIATPLNYGRLRKSPFMQLENQFMSIRWEGDMDAKKPPLPLKNFIYRITEKCGETNC